MFLYFYSFFIGFESKLSINTNYSYSLKPVHVMNFMEIYEELNHASNFFKKFNPLFLYGILIKNPNPELKFNSFIS